MLSVFDEADEIRAGHLVPTVSFIEPGFVGSPSGPGEFNDAESGRGPGASLSLISQAIEPAGGARRGFLEHAGSVRQGDLSCFQPGEEVVACFHPDQ